MISKNKIKYILSLQKKKVRDEKRQYVIEGDKLIKEYLLAGVRFHLLAAKPEFVAALLPDEKGIIDEVEELSYEDLKRISTLKSPHNAIGVVPFPEYETGMDEIFEDLCVALDFIQDPGNMGTIIRAAAWFGIKNIVCSENCVDVYNPKVIQATMGAILNVRIHYSDLRSFLPLALRKNLPVFGAVLEGDSIYSQELEPKGVILLGNESKGISKHLYGHITRKIKIPGFTEAKYGIDSLNVSMAAAVIFSEFARRR